MNIPEFNQARRQLNTRLAELITQELGKFKAETGVSGSDVGVEIHRDTQITGPVDYLVGSVRVEVDLSTANQPTRPHETPFQIGQRLRQEGKGISDLWGAVNSDAEMTEAQRGYESQLPQDR